MRDPEEQRRQRRAVAAVLAGVVVLGAAGIGASLLLVGGPCEDLLPASFTSPPAVVDGAEVLPAIAPDADASAISEAVVATGAALDLGPVRGATPGAPDATAVPVDDAVFVVADDEHVRILDTGIVAVATGRERPQQTRFLPAGEQVGVVQRDLTGDVLLARFDEDLGLTGCLELDPPGIVVHLSRGLALVARGEAVEATGFDGGPLWSVEGVAGTPTVDAATTGLLAVLASDEEVAAYDLRSGEPRWAVTADQLGGSLTDDPILLAGDDLVVVATTSGVVRLAGEDGAVIARDEVGGAATAAATTGRDVVVVAGAELLRFDGDAVAERVALPGTATSPPVVRGDTVLVVTDVGLVRAGGDGDVAVAGDLPFGTVAVAGGYTLVGLDVGEGLLVFYGPAGAPAA